MVEDIRLARDILDHRKTKKLCAKLGDGAFLCLLRLWIYAANHRPDGILDGLATDDIEIEAQWTGEPGQFVAALVEIGWLEEVSDEQFLLHEWATYQPWVYGAAERSDAARRNVLSRYHGEGKHKTPKEGCPECKATPEYTERIRPVNAAYTPFPSSPIPSLPTEERDLPKKVSLSPGSDDRPPGPAWPEDLLMVRDELAKLDIPDTGRGTLHDPKWWKTIGAWLGDHPRVMVMLELRKWWAYQLDKPKRHRNLKRSFREWLSRAENWSDRAAKTDQERRDYYKNRR